MKATLIGLALLAAGTCAPAAETANDLPFNAVQEKKNVEVKLAGAALAELGESGGRINGLHGMTADFQGRQLPLYALFAPSVQEAQWMPFMERQGRIEGRIHCARVRVGNSPQIPQIKLGVLAQDCVIRKLQ